MSAGKLDRSLDEILKDRRANARRPRRARPANGAKAAAPAAAPVGGVKKTTKPTKSAGKAAIPTGPSSGSGESKIIVSNLVRPLNKEGAKQPMLTYCSRWMSPSLRSRYVKVRRI